ncbi:hypothetical protein, partial [Burkholderia vietnamiensis]|uniref:hypothetical protein n=1 Tax=Burkholderia vietnamiensis TaxID=60552 RepID=UPI003FEEA6EA
AARALAAAHCARIARGTVRAFALHTHVNAARRPRPAGKFHHARLPRAAFAESHGTASRKRFAIMFRSQTIHRNVASRRHTGKRLPISLPGEK